MDEDHFDARLASTRDLAGSDYEFLLESKERALDFLSAADYRLRLGAVLVCKNIWNAGADPRVLDACYRIAESDAEESGRIVAVHMLGSTLQSSKDPDASRFLANLVIESVSAGEVRTAAYWALREIQFGLADTDFDTRMKGLISQVKWMTRAFPEKFNAERVKQILTPRPGFPEDFWDTAEAIDWDLVHHFATLT